MTPRVRTFVLALAGLVLLPAVWRIASALPPFGVPTAKYGAVVNELGPQLRRVANQISGVNFDFRGFDTLGEEFMLICAVTGTVILLRGQRGENTVEEAGFAEGRAREPRSDAVTLVCRLFGPLTLLFGFYIAVHASVTPGCGFQGGVIAASGLLLVYLGEGYETWRRLVLSKVLEVMEGGGALLFASAGCLPVALGRPYLENVLPLGTFGDALSGGLILVENLGVFLAVTGSFALLFVEFLEETRALPSNDDDA